MRQKKRGVRRVAIIGVLTSAGLSIALYGIEAAQATKSEERAESQFDDTETKLQKSLLNIKLLLRNARETEHSLDQSSTAIAEIGMQSQEIAKKQVKMLTAQSIALSTEGRLRLWQVRSFFPIAPASLIYSVEFPMDNEPLEKYVKRISESLRRLNKGYDVPITGKDLPGQSDGWGVGILGWASIAFKFTDKAGIPFRFDTPSYLDSSGSKCKLQLFANLMSRLFIQKVSCVNLEPLGDSLAFSSLDLIGKKMTWKTTVGDFRQPEGRAWQVRYVSFIFPHELEGNPEIDLSDQLGSRGIILTAQSLNLSRVLKAARN